jgi:PhzF family phenazine biosynthesis protein
MRQWMIDAFASAAFKGNPACVVEPFDAWPDADWMQRLASENNQAETAFLLKTADPAHFGLRWFTPAIEVPLCGHATLASTHALFAELGVATDAVTFDTKSGPLIVRKANGGYRMDFPAGAPRRIDPPPGLAAALGVEPREVFVDRFLVAVLAEEAEVRALTPDLAALMRIGAEATEGRGNVGVSAIAPPGAGYDVVSRFFAPGSGIPEDPTTGGLHCTLSPLFAEKLGRKRLKFHQAYPGRGGDLECETAGERVWLDGAAVTVLEGRLRSAAAA